MNEGNRQEAGKLTPREELAILDRVCTELERGATSTSRPQIEALLDVVPEQLRERALGELIAVEAELRKKAGDAPTWEEYARRFPTQLTAAFRGFRHFAPATPLPNGVSEARLDELSRAAGSAEFGHDSIIPPTAKMPASQVVDVGDSDREEEPIPDCIGPYQIHEVLGTGGFGRVYRANDPVLGRDVAIKGPSPRRWRMLQEELQRRFSANAADRIINEFMEEARKVAGLKHPGLVAVYEFRVEDGRPFIVQELIDGQTLRQWYEQQHPDHQRFVCLLVQVAEVLRYAHQQGLIHRDLKPSNIMVDANDHAFVMDFGLALHESVQLQHRGDSSGTPAYMSPEQVRGEAHRMDGRSDLWSLGVIGYELLTGRRPFDGSVSELLERIQTVAPRPLRMLKSDVPSELDRICLKLLQKQQTDRYSSAAELIDDLQHWLDAQRPEASATVQAPVTPRPVQVIPKGLRSFDEHDADFFLELLPGPRDRDGLPDSIRFWKQKIETVDGNQTFSVGLLYGPSGCGKSSLVKAGLLPRLSATVLVVYVAATPDNTENQIAAGIRKHLPDLGDADPGSLLLQVRERGVGSGRKLLLVIDQFEQWLHSNSPAADVELIRALRQCDGQTLQAIVMLRDDFVMAANRLMDALDVSIVEGQNYATVDLFDAEHAKNVLLKLGHAYNRLPENADEMSRDQKLFLEAAAGGLADKGRVIPVRLALFAEMVKSQPWKPATLKAVGGTEGVGVNFLEETFGSRSANPKHRLHQQAARHILKALLPEIGSDIKGNRRSHGELLKASGYGDRAGEFDELLTILDSELRLITPTESTDTTEERQSSYQLTHDYLVPSLREWLTQKQRETPQGRAELTLAERSALWNSKPESRRLPSLWEWVRIRTLTDSRKWTESQHNMMSRAARFHGIRSAFGTAALVILLAAGMIIRANLTRQREADRIEGLVGGLISAEPSEIPEIVEQLDANPTVADTFLSPLLSQGAETLEQKRSRLHARLAKVSRDSSLVEPLKESLLTDHVDYVLPIRQLLKPAAGTMMEELSRLLRTETEDARQRFRAALALADYVPISESAFWTEQDLTFVAEQLVSSNAEYQPQLREALRPISDRLLGDLERIFADSDATDGQRLSAANAFADYAAADIERITELLIVADPEQYDVLFPIVAANPVPSTLERLSKIAAELPPDDLGSVERIAFGQRRANAAVTLLRLGERERVLPVFEMTDDPEALTQFIFRCRPRDVGVDALLDCLELVGTAPQDRYPQHARYALLLSLGEFEFEEVPMERRTPLLTQLTDWYANDPSSGVHGAAGWLLRNWGQTEIARQVDETPVPYSAGREWFTLAITVAPTSVTGLVDEISTGNSESESTTEQRSDSANTDSKVAEPNPSNALDAENVQRQTATGGAISARTLCFTFVAFPKGEYTLGSVEGRESEEMRHTVRITRPFAVLDREITFEEQIAYIPKFAELMTLKNARPIDAGFGINWYHSVGFCCWLSEQSCSEPAYEHPLALDVNEYPRDAHPDANWAPRNWPVDPTKQGFRLPTEAEWEIATRAGVPTTYSFGNDAALLHRFAWYNENSLKRVHPPKEKRPNIRGLFDLHGNLYEWTHDWFGEYPDGATDPLGPDAGVNRVVRGGSWFNDTADCRAANRYSGSPERRALNHGFRIALSLPESAPATATAE